MRVNLSVKKICVLLLLSVFLVSGLVYGPVPSFAEGEVTGSISSVKVNGQSVDNGGSLNFSDVSSLNFAFNIGFNLSDLAEKYKTVFTISYGGNSDSTVRVLEKNSINFSETLSANRTYSVQIELFDKLDETGVSLASTSFTLAVGNYDTTPPKVISSSRLPESGEYNVPINQNIQFAFDEPVTEQSITAAGNITLKYGTTSQGFTASLGSDGKTVTLSPAGGLKYNQTYTVALKAGGIKDLAGNGVQATSWSFATVSDPTAAPVIESRDPASGATKVPVNKNIVITLNKEIDTSTVTGRVILKKGSTVVPASIYSENVNGKGRITLDPISNLENATVYTVSITGSQIRDVDGKYLASASWSFTTEQGALPVIIDRSPSANERYVPTDVQISIKFSQAMNSSTMTTSNIYLRKAGSSTNISSTISYSSSGRTAYLKPRSELQLDTDYYVYVSGNVKDSNNIAMAATNWRFTTIDKESVRILEKEPAQNAINVPVDTKISFKFSRAMYSSSVNGSNIYLKRSGYSSKVSADVDYDSSTRVVTITPSSKLRYNTDYTVYITDDVRDSDRNYITAVSWDFTTMDEDYLHITDRDPAPNADNVAVSKKITIKFSTSMKSSTINSSNIYLRKSGYSSNIPITVSYDSRNRTVTLTPTNNLAGNTKYTVYVTAKVQDVDGTAMKAENWSFTTKYDVAKMIYSDPAKDATGVPVNKLISATFDKALTSSTITNSTVYLKKYGATSQVPASIAYNRSNHTITISPVSKLEYGTRYTVYLTSSIKDGEEEYISSTNWTFFTEAEPVRRGTKARPVVRVNGKYVNFTDAFPYMKNNRTMIPFRALFEAINAEVGYDDSGKQPKITGKLGNNIVVLYAGNLTAYRNNVAIRLDVPAEIINGRTMVPLRFVGEALGATVDWEEKTYTVIIEQK